MALDAPAARRSPRHPAIRALAVAAAVALAYWLPSWLGGSPLTYGFFVTLAIFSVMAVGVDIVLSYLGEVSLGHTIFWAIGGYSAAILSTSWDANGWITAATAVGLAVLAAAFLGWATLKTREFVFSLATYAAAVVAGEIAFNTDALGGSDGIVGIPALRLPLGFAEFSGRSNQELWPLALLLLVLSIYFVDRFRRSRLGTEALMVQMNPPLAIASGLDIRKVRFRVFVVSAPITALAGWLYGYQRAYVGPDMFDMYFLTLMLTAVIVVGRRVLLGPLIGVALILLQQNYFSIGGDGNKVVLGAVLAFVLIVWPQGLAGLARRIWRARAQPRS
ncbi:branched-chain amino acid ABC transporter permease [Chelatococcus reniformis]|uniref:Branched-chain amino acid ABC transporter permease n=2 Tax=Chelatococcus reniformis TaxID=1494448 RepID=A0A916XP76_9HYPH|nr:branched-chain amino acid ABC transporter permease [Chelatococcus reniformis]